MTKKTKILLTTAILASAGLMSSCINKETTSELRIDEQCNTASDLCKFELTNAEVTRQTNLLGQTRETIVSQSSLQNIEGTITWETTGTLANNDDVVSAFGSGCEDGVCTENANPTAYNFVAGPHSIAVSGNVIVDGKSVDLSSAVPAVDIETEETADSFVFDRQGNPSLPDGQTIDDVVAALNVNSAAAHGTFTSENGAVKITCDDGYEWLDDVNPSWGQSHTYDVSRSVVYVYYDGVDWNSMEEVASTKTRNGLIFNFNATDFTYGCWPV